MMFNDEPSPFRPRHESNTPVSMIACVLAGAFGMYLFSQWQQAREAPTHHLVAQPMSAPVAEAPNEPAMRPRVLVAPSPTAAFERSASLAAPRPDRTTIYLCKGYGGGSFWSNQSCQVQRATIDRMTSVPGDLPFDRQVAIASGEAQAAAALYAAPAPAGAAAIGPATPAASPGFDCASLNAAITQIDAAARQPQSASMQDGLRQERMRLQTRRAAQAC